MEITPFIKDSIRFVIEHYEKFKHLKSDIESLVIVEKEHTTVGCFYSFTQPESNTKSSVILTDGFYAYNEEKDLLIDLIVYIEDNKISCLEVMNVLGDFPQKDPTIYKLKKVSVNIINDFEN